MSLPILKLHTCIITILLFLSGNTYAYIVKNLASLRQHFKLAESYLNSGNISKYLQHKEKLNEYPLLSYLHYSQYSRKLANLSLTQLDNFTTNYADSPISGKLRKQWLIQQATNKKWHNYLKGYKYSQDAELQCYFIHAYLVVNPVHSHKEVLRYVSPLWLTAKSQPKACDHVFKVWQQQGYQTRSLIWKRIKLAINNNNIELTRFLSKKLSAEDQSLVELWIRTHNNPQIINNLQYFTKKHPAIKEILIYALDKITIKDPLQSISLWQTLSEKHSFSERHKGQVLRSIGISLANQKHPQAALWLEQIPKAYINTNVFDARLKVALYQADWQTIIALYQLLPTNLKRTAKWQYWFARALDMTGRKQQGQEILSKLSQIRSYYGFLASLRVLKPYSLKNNPAKFTPQQLHSVANIEGIKRAYELLQLNRDQQATNEWLFSINTFTEEQRLIAAHLATEWHKPNWAILALANAENKNSLNLRFPQNYSEYILKAAKNNSLDPALIFAITRQESAFVPYARSSAGALGLMQLIPKTAKEVAKVHNITIKNNHDILKIDKNIYLGSKYLRMMLNQYQNNTVLAAAAYNAGPNRITNWLPNNDMPADCWIETIPFKETRNYVQNVLTYTVIYQQLLGQELLLHKHMPIIVGKS